MKSGESYNEASSRLKAEAMESSINLHKKLLEVGSSRRVNFRKIDELKPACEEFLDICAEYGQLPTFEKLATFLGVARCTLYLFLSEENTDATDYLRTLQTSFGSMMMDGALSRNLSEVMSIFVLKNSALGFQDKVSVEALPIDNTHRLSTEDLIEQSKLLP